jgi:hypothetical protein
LPEASRAYVEKLTMDDEMIDTSIVSHAGRLLMSDRFQKLMTKPSGESKKGTGKTLRVTNNQNNQNNPERTQN